MSKVNQNSNTTQQSVTYFLVKGFALLQPSVRKELSLALDKIYVPKQGYKAWKYRYLYPVRNIPKKNWHEFITNMTELLAFYLQKQVDIINNQVEEINLKIRKQHLKIEEKKVVENQIADMILKYKNNEYVEEEAFV
jgi:hypothetical protein